MTIKPDATPLELAKIALEAHGGDKFKQMKTLVMRGSMDVTSANFPQTLSGSFAMIFKGDKYRLQINTPFINFIQTFDGEQTYSSVGNVTIPPINRLGLPLLAKLETNGFTVSALDDKKKRGFRINTPEGYSTDFTIDEKTGQIKSYSAVYNVNNREITTAVEHDKFRTVDGLLLAEKYAQRFDAVGQTFYADFKAKEILVNSEVADDVFVLSK